MSSIVSNPIKLTLLMLVVTIMIVCFAPSGYSKPLCIETEKKALLSFKKDLRDPNKILKSWDIAGDGECCKWAGIRCDNVTGHVNEISLDSRLTGKINPSLLNLTRLTHLDLRFNYIGVISIPSFIGSLVSLRSLRLNGGFTGLIPHQLGNLSSLRQLDLGSNINLESKNLKWLSSMSSLEFINMNYVSLSEASDHWLLAINKIPSLVELHLFSCQLRHFDFPSHVNLTSLKVLDLGSNSLQGQVPWAIGNLTSLVSLDLKSNSLSKSHIPKSIGNLCNLEIFDFSDNILRGEVSKAFESLSEGCLPKKLKHLYLDNWNDHALTSHIPDVIGVFKSLVYLSLSGNNIYGSIPSSFGALSNLKYFDISLNHLEGEVSEIHFANLTKLTTLKASGNKLTLKVNPDWNPPFRLNVLEIGSWNLGPQFPMWLNKQTILSALDLSNTVISDTVPSWFWNISTHLQIIDLSQNQIYGQIPNLHGFQEIYLNNNNFNGSLPRISSEVHVLDLSKNSLSSDMSHFLCHPLSESPNLSVLNLRNNLLSGEVPDCWSHWSEGTLNYLDLSNNNLTGKFPSSMGELSWLKTLHLQNNRFTGEIPNFLQNYQYMTSIDLGYNEFVGNIPTWLGKLQNLQLLGLHSNKLTGNIPVELCAMASLKILDIAHNNLSGTIPKCFKNLTTMTTGRPMPETIFALFQGPKITDNANIVTKGMDIEYGNNILYVRMIDISSNNLSGEIPEELTSLIGLQYLNLSKNGFRGRIPAQIGKLTNLESLDLSRNKLSGPIPSSLSSLNFLAYLELSHNNLSGRIPTGTQLQGFEASWFVGNHLCGPPLTKDCGENDNTMVKGVIIDDEESNDDEEFWFRLGIAVGFGVGFLGIILPLLSSRIWRNAYFWFFEEYLWYKIVDHLNCLFRKSLFTFL